MRLRSHTARKSASNTEPVGICLVCFVELGVGPVDHDQVTIAVGDGALVSRFTFNAAARREAEWRRCCRSRQPSSRGPCKNGLSVWRRSPASTRMRKIHLHFVAVAPAAGSRKPIDYVVRLRVDGSVAYVLGPDSARGKIGQNRGNVVEPRGADPGNVVVKRRNSGDCRDSNQE